MSTAPAPRISPHPDFESYTTDEIKAEVNELEDKIKLARDIKDEENLSWFKIEKRLALAELRNRDCLGQTEPDFEDSFIPHAKENKPCGINFPLQTWGDFLSTDFEEQPFTIEGLVPDSGLIAFHGRGKEGKTTFLIHGCRAVATGQLFLNRATTQKPVVYLNYEMGFPYLKKLLGAGGPCPEEAYLLNRPEPVLQIATIEALMVGVNRPGVMVIDSFRGAFRLHGDAENSAGGAGVILRNIQDIVVKHKWVVIVVHHRNRGAKEGTDGISGTSDWIAAPDVIWSWSRSDTAKPGTFSVEGRMPPVDPIAVQLSPEACVFMGTVEESRGVADKETILAALTVDGQTADALAEATGLPAGTVRARLESLFKDNLVVRDGEGKRGSPFLWSKINSAQDISLACGINSNGHESRTVQDAVNIFGGRIIRQ